jgi:hypothetical protein
VVLAVVVVAPVREAVDVVLVVEALWAGERRRERRRESARDGNFIVGGLMIGFLGSSILKTRLLPRNCLRQRCSTTVPVLSASLALDDR